MSQLLHIVVLLLYGCLISTSIQQIQAVRIPPGIHERIRRDEPLSKKLCKNLLNSSEVIIGSLNGAQGTLSIDPTVTAPNTTCGWFSSASPLLLHFKIIKLSNDDKIVITSSNKTYKTFSSNASGLVAIEEGDWMIEVHFGPSKVRRSLEIDFSRHLYMVMSRVKINPLVINELITKDDRKKPSNDSLKFIIVLQCGTCIGSTGVLLEANTDNLIVDPPLKKLDSGFVYSDKEMKLTISPKPDEQFQITVLYASSRCSSYTIDPVDKELVFDRFRTFPFFHEESSRCANVMKMSDPKAFFQLDFTRAWKSYNAKDTTQQATLTLSKFPLFLNSTTIKEYAGKIVTYQGNELVVISELSYPYSLGKIKVNGGLVVEDQTTGIMRKPMNNGAVKFINYIYKGQHPYSSIVFNQSSNAKMSVKIYENQLSDEPLIAFKDQHLPPMISSGYNKTLIVEFRAREGESITNRSIIELSHKFTTHENSCNKLSNGDFDYFSFDHKMQAECIWTITASKPHDSELILSLDHFEFFNDDDCIQVVGLPPYTHDDNRVATTMVNACGNHKFDSPSARLTLDKYSKYYVRLTKDKRTPALSFHLSYSFVKSYFHPQKTFSQNNYDL